MSPASEQNIPEQRDRKDFQEANVHCYRDYYAKPLWWFRFRYDTQVKRKTVLHLVKKAGKSLERQRVLEIGFGSGAVIFSFHPTCEIHGVEISPTAINAAKKRARERGYQEFSFHFPEERLPVHDGTMDIVIASHVLEHVQDDAMLLRETHRVLKPDGIAVVLVPINERYHDPNHVRQYSTHTLGRLAKQSGFKVNAALENELLFHLVEKFYFEGYSKRWKFLGPLIVALFNIPTSLIPFSGYRFLDAILEMAGLHPRQTCALLTKKGQQTQS